MKDEPRFEIVELERMSPEARQRAIEYLKDVANKNYQQLQAERQEEERKRKETIRILESRFVYCPTCCGVTAKLDEHTVCPNCGTFTIPLTQAQHEKLIWYLNNSKLDVELDRYIWRSEYGEQMTCFVIRHQGHEFCGTESVLQYRRFDETYSSAVRLEVMLTENDWDSIRTFLQNLNISRWITPCDMALSHKSLRYSDPEIPDQFLCSGDRPYFRFNFLADPNKELPQKYLELFEFIRQVFLQTEAGRQFENCGIGQEKTLTLPDVRATIRDDNTEQIHLAEIPFQSKVMIGDSAKAHILLPTSPFSFALCPQVGHFLIKGGSIKLLKVWNGEKWICGDTVKKGERFQIKGHPFTLIDFEYIHK